MGGKLLSCPSNLAIIFPAVSILIFKPNSLRVFIKKFLALISSSEKPLLETEPFSEAPIEEKEFIKSWILSLFITCGSRIFKPAL